MNALFSMFESAVGAVERVFGAPADEMGPSRRSPGCGTALPAAMPARAARAPGMRKDVDPIAYHSEVPGPEDGTRHRQIRDCYIKARFPGVVRAIDDLQDAPKVIEAARLYFEDGSMPRAQELLDLATGSQANVQPLWLARLELAFLLRDAPGYLRVAQRFHRRHPGAKTWPEIRELGRNLGISDELFRDQGVRESFSTRYGPCPNLPGWLQASWDLTPDTLRAELHMRMAACADGDPRVEPQREVA